MIRASCLDARDWSEKRGADRSTFFCSGRLRRSLQKCYFCSGCLI
jgi:hypothetical protein